MAVGPAPETREREHHETDTSHQQGADEPVHHIGAVEHQIRRHIRHPCQEREEDVGHQEQHRDDRGDGQGTEGGDTESQSRSGLTLGSALGLVGEEVPETPDGILAVGEEGLDGSKHEVTPLGLIPSNR